MNLIPWSSKLIRPGDKYGRLTIIETCIEKGTYRYYAFASCDCGSPPTYHRIDGIRKGVVQSCGCLHREKVTKHGRWGHPLFTVWVGMNARCSNPKDKRFRHYGGRGIKICERWNNIEHFIEDMMPTYRNGTKIERIDNDGDYKPENCRWATNIEQARNKSSNVLLTHEGKTLTLAEWSQITGITYGTLWDRVRSGWSDLDVLTTLPIDPSLRHLSTRCQKCK